MIENLQTDTDSTPTKVCSNCSVQTRTSGDFCPHCGKGYGARRRALSKKAIGVLVAIVVVLALAGGGYAMKLRSDETDKREAAAAERAEAAAKKERAEEDAAEAAAQARRAEQAAQRAERAERKSLITQMQASITKDAKKRVADGELDGPIFYTSCDPLGGGSVDDLTALTTTFECLAVNEKLGGGQVRGWVFSSTVNWDEASWSWRLGS